MVSRRKDERDGNGSGGTRCAVLREAGRFYLKDVPADSRWRCRRAARRIWITGRVLASAGAQFPDVRATFTRARIDPNPAREPERLMMGTAEPRAGKDSPGGS